MATYFHGNNSEIQENGGDGLQTLILMNPGYVGYSEAQHQPPVSGSSSSNLVFPNSNYPPSQTSQQYYFGGGATSASPQDSHFYNPYNGAAREATHAKKGLSLRLSSQQPTGYGEMQSQLPGVEDLRVSNDMQSGVLSCKYLKAAQELLDEVVNVGKGERDNRQSKNINGESFGANGDGENGGEKIAKRGAELTTAEKQEIQMKKAKLVNMLDEVEQRYKQYHQQMQIVISWFEQVAGIGSAKTYTALALQTISKQFRCLKHAILSQIKIASKSLGEVDNWEGKIEGLRIKYVDNQIRQQGALQHLGMIQHNAWRPQRGLPERSVSVLRAWLFEHFLHPYPKDSDKIMLAKQTGLSRSQVSNWFINARVRLWKPMVEEMYTEEIKENDGNGSEDKHSKTEQNQVSTSQATAPQAKGSESEYENKSFISEQEDTMRNNAGFNLIGSSEMESIIQGSPKKPRITDMLQSPSNIPSMNMESSPSNVDNEHASMKFGDERQGRDGFTLMEAPTNFIGGFGSYPMVELGRFGSEQFQAPYSRNGVSLSLGLHQNFLPNQNIQLGRGAEIGEADEFNGMNAPTSTQSNSSYENINIQNRKSFASQLFPDFVT